MKNILTALLIVLIILFVFNKPICKAISDARIKLGIDDPQEEPTEEYSSLGAPENVPGVLKYLEEHRDEKADMNNKENYEATGPAIKSYRNSIEGLVGGSHSRQYLPSGEWEQWIQQDELDPSIAENHREFTENIQRFYTGASFTSVDEDNRDVFSTNFVGLRRPKGTPIGPGVRQIQDVDESVLQRNKRFLL